MRKKRLIWALGAVLAVAAIAASAVLWKAGNVLRRAAGEVEREGYYRFTAAGLERQVPSGFETLSAPAGFLDAAVYSDHLFIAGDAGLFEYDSAGTLLRSYRTGLELPSAPITAMANGIGGGSQTQELWLATAGEGALAFDGTRFRQIRPEAADARKLTSVLPLATGRILFGSEKKGLLAFDGKHVTPPVPALADAHVTAVAGEEASLWIGTQDAGVYHWHAGQLDHFGESEGLPDAHVFSIAVDAGGAFASTTLGIAEIRDGRVQRVLARGFTVQASLRRSDELLAGTLDEGLLHVPLDVKSKPSAAGEAANIRRLLATGGDVLALTPDGLFRIGTRRGEWTPVLKAAEARLADRNVSALAPDGSGGLWIGYFDRGLDILDAARTNARHFEDDVLFCVNRILHDRTHDRTAVATSNGLAMFSPRGERREVLTRREGLIANQITDVLFRPDGAMIAGTPAGVSFIEASRVASIYAFHGLVNNHVYALGQSGPRTLVGTLGGLSVIENGFATVSFTRFNSRFTHNWVTAVLPVAGDIFIGTYGGGILHTVAGRGWETFVDLPKQFEVNSNAMAASDRAIFAGTLDRGLALYDRAAGRWRWIIRGLPSRNVTAVAVDNSFVYIGTDNGLVRVPEDNLLK